MVRSLYSGVSGLHSNQTRMDVIGNNIANVNTYGFKSSRVVFSDLFYQTLNAAQAPAASGGINPAQLGYGSAVSSIDILNTRSGMQTTDRALDLYIAGEGYFQVMDGSGAKFYTRVGNFKFDVNGDLVDSNGLFVCGTDGNKINVNVTNYSNITISSNGTITGLSATGTIDELGHIGVAKFVNADGLSQEGNSYYTATSNSGTPTFGAPGTNATGTLVSGALEMSNVDLAREFTDMITTQRGYQANSRVITTSDSMLEELVNLKR